MREYESVLVVLYIRVSYQNTSLFLYFGKYTNIPHVCCPNFDSIPIYLILGVRYTNIPMFSENSSNIPIYRMHDLGAQKGHTNIPHVFENGQIYQYTSI